MSDESKSAPMVERAQQPSFFTRIWFEELGLPSHVLSGLRDCGFTLCTPLQSQVIPLALSGKDVVARAETGTGKIASYLLPILARLPERSTASQGDTSALIVVPTAELARHISEDIRRLSATHTSLSHALVTGNEDHAEQSEVFRLGPDIIIGTPPVLIDLIKQGAFRVSGVNVLVVDEADRFFDLNLVKHLRYLLRKLPHSEKRRSVLFARSLSYRILALVYHYMNGPEFVSGVSEESQLKGMEQSLFHVDSREKGSLLLSLLKREEWKRTMVFANTPAAVEEVGRILKENGLPVESVSEDVPPRKRFRMMARLNRGGARILVTTDAVSGSLYMECVSHIVNYDLPLAPLLYFQRAGRATATKTPRRTISFACEEYVFHLEPIEEALGYKIPVAFPEDDLLAERKVETATQESETLKESAPKRQEAEEKKPLQLKGGARIVFSSEPGGVFGLAVERVSPPEQGGTEPKKKPRRRRPKRREQKKEEAGAGNNSGNDGKPSGDNGTNNGNNGIIE